MLFPKTAAAFSALVLLPLALGYFPARALAQAVSGDQCAAMTSPSWSSTERWVWQQLCYNDGADFSDSDAPTDHRVSADFLQDIVESNPYRAALPGAIQVSGATVTGEINLEYAVVEHPLWLEVCNFTSTVDLKGISVPDLSLYHSTFHGDLQMSDMHVDKSLEMDNATVSKTVDLSNTIIGGHLSAKEVASSGTKLAGKFDMSDTRVESYVDLWKMRMDTLNVSDAVLGDWFRASSAQFTSLNLTNARIGENLNLNGLRAHYVDIRGVSVQQSLFIRSSANIQNVFLTGMRVGGQVDITPGVRFGFFSAYGIHVGEQFFLRNSPHAGRFRLDSSVIGGDVNISDDSLDDVLLNGTTISGRLLLKNLNVRGDCLCERLNVGGDMPMLNGKFGGMVSLRALQVHGNLTISGGSYSSIDLSTAQIFGDLMLNAGKTSIWRDGGELSLRNASAQAFEDRTNACPSPGPSCVDPWPNYLDLDGFSYQQLGALTQDRPELQIAHKREAHDPPSSQQDGDMADRAVGRWQSWLQRSEFSVQPYEQLATVLRQVGRPDDATQVLFAGKDQELAHTGFPQDVFLFLDREFVGYGYYPYYALFWTLLMMAIGAFVINATGERARLTRAAAPDAPQPFPLKGWVYSFDMLVPLVTLYKPDDDLHLRGFAQYYFWVHRLVGFALASFLVAAISGLTK